MSWALHLQIGDLWSWTGAPEEAPGTPGVGPWGADHGTMAPGMVFIVAPVGADRGTGLRMRRFSVAPGLHVEDAHRVSPPGVVFRVLALWGRG